MTPTVHILASCINPDLVRATTLVFDTLRLGFPTAEITVHFNRLLPEVAKPLIALADKCAAEIIPCDTIHAKWITELIDRETKPFFICDTDVVFWKSFEQWSFTGAVMVGRLVPQFYDSWTRCVTRSRLHTSLLYLDPHVIKILSGKYMSAFPESPFVPRPDLISPMIVPAQPRSYFNDATCLLFHAIGGRAFTESQLDCYDHLGTGTLADSVEIGYPGMKVQNAIMLDNPKIMRGLWREHDKFYVDHAV